MRRVRAGGEKTNWLTRSPQKNHQDMPKSHLLSLFFRYMMVSMKSIRDILQEVLEEYTQIRANESDILRLCQASTAKKRPGSVELEKQGLLIGEDR